MHTTHCQSSQNTLPSKIALFFRAFSQKNIKKAQKDRPQTPFGTFFSPFSLKKHQNSNLKNSTHFYQNLLLSPIFSLKYPKFYSNFSSFHFLHFIPFYLTVFQYITFVLSEKLFVSLQTSKIKEKTLDEDGQDLQPWRRAKTVGFYFRDPPK